METILFKLTISFNLTLEWLHVFQYKWSNFHFVFIFNLSVIYDSNNNKNSLYSLTMWFNSVSQFVYVSMCRCVYVCNYVHVVGHRIFCTKHLIFPLCSLQSTWWAAWKKPEILLLKKKFLCEIVVDSKLMKIHRTSTNRSSKARCKIENETLKWWNGLCYAIIAYIVEKRRKTVRPFVIKTSS